MKAENECVVEVPEVIQLLLIVIYIAFIGLGLPDSLLGSAWPSMYVELSVPVSYAGIISMTIAAGTVVSSLMSDRLSKRFHAGKITAVSTVIMALSMAGFALSPSFFVLWLWAIPYGLGAGSVDAALNNYVALHYPSRHMSWLHCMWGVGTIVGPGVMGVVLTGGGSWQSGYGTMALLQAAVAAILVISLPLWKKNKTLHTEAAEEEAPMTIPLLKLLRMPGAKEIMFAFFCYSAVEQTSMLWGSTYLVLHHGMAAETAAGFASLFFIGITAGRGLGGFLTYRFSDTQMIRAGQALILFGVIALFLSRGSTLALVGLIVIGVGCAPIYPSIIHSTPERFGADKSQAFIGVQMASAYVGTCLMPPLFGLIANHICVGLFPVYLLAVLLLMVFMHEGLLKKLS